MAMAKRGTPYVPPADRPKGPRSPETARQQQLYDLERSVKYGKETLGLGLR